MPKNFRLVTFPDPVGHFGAPWRPYWILHALQCCRWWASAPFAARLVFKMLLAWAFGITVTDTYLNPCKNRSFVWLLWKYVVFSDYVPIDKIKLRFFGGNVIIRGRSYLKNFFLWCICRNLLSHKRQIRNSTYQEQKKIFSVKTKKQVLGFSIWLNFHWPL